MKYVIFEYPNGARFPVIFGNHTTHSTIKLEMEKGTYARPISAGEFKIGPHGVETFGESSSLHLKPRKTDARMLLFTLTNADALLIERNCAFIEKKRQKGLALALGLMSEPKTTFDRREADFTDPTAILP